MTLMDTRPADLDQIRREIDELDEQLHDLLIRRAALTNRVRLAKVNDGSLFLRPGREAAMLRRLAARHHGELPKSALIRIWRELMGGLYKLQGTLKVAVHAPEKSVGYWDLARNQFGSTITMSLHRAAATVLRAVCDEPLTVGLLAKPYDGERDPWWQHLASDAARTPKVIARLPFVENSDGRFEEVLSYLVALAQPEASGQDGSLLVISVSPDAVSRGRVADLLKKAGMPGRVIASSQDGASRSRNDSNSVERNGPDGNNPPRHGTELLLAEVDGFILAGDPKLQAFLKVADGAAHSAVPIGAYALPVGTTQS